MRTRTRSLIAGGAVAALALGSSTALISSADAASQTRAVGLSSNGKKLTLFDIRTGARKATVGNVRGLVAPDTKLIGIDFRVQNHAYYVVGNGGGIYKLASSTGTATKVSQVTVPLQGTHFGVDFNPAADRLRIVSDTGQNLRHDLTANTTVADGPLAYTAGTQATGITAVAYTNNDLSPASATSLFDIDTALNQIALQVPANAGTLLAQGPLGINPDAIAGFDIQSTTRGGIAVSNTGYATFRSSATGESRLYRIDLLSGKATRVATFKNDIADIAVPQP